MSVAGAQPQCPWGHRPLWADLLLREPRLRRALPAVAPATPSSSASPAVWGEEEVESGSLGVGFKSAKQEPCSVRKAWAFTCPFSLRAWKTRHSRNAADTVFENTQYSVRDAAGTEHELAGFESERGWWEDTNQSKNSPAARNFGRRRRQGVMGLFWQKEAERSPCCSACG